MKKNLLKLILSVFIICPYVLLAQTFTITEVTDGGKLYTVASSTTNIGKKTIIHNYNADINSSLKIKINTNKINEEANAWIGNPVSIPFKRMENVKRILEKRQQLLQQVNISPTAPLQVRKEALNDFSKNVSEMFKLVVTEMRNTPLYAKVNTIFAGKGTSAEKYAAFFDALSTEIDEITEQYKAALEANKVYFRMGAFINQTPVHMEGFDTFKENEYYKIPRFATTIDADEKKRFDDAKAFAEDANKNIGAAFKAKLKEAIDPILKSFENNIKEKFSAPLDSFESGIQKIDALSLDFKKRIAERQSQLTTIETNIQLLISGAENTNDPDYITTIETNINTLIDNIEAFQTNLDSDLVYIKKLPDAAKPIFDKFKSSYGSGQQIVKSTLNDLKTFFDDQARLNISIPDKINESLLKLGSEVNNVQLNNIPEETEINLLTAGNRKQGDRIYIKAVLSKQPATAETSVEKTIEFTNVGITQVGFHSTIKAVLLFADNTSAEYSAKKQFQLVPSYSVLFKYGTRYHNQFNRYIAPGLGVNMATLDFNNDNTPEIGIGVVGSLFQDYLQVGYGRNMSADQNYWFFGIRLPFIGVNLSGKTKVITED